MPAQQGDEEVIVAWLRQNAIPIQHVEAGHGFDDLQPLKQILMGVKIVGLGEATHGTREFFQFKHRLLEFLVTEMNFNAFALEASYSACQPINEYILYGKGDRTTVLSDQGYIPWDTEEFRKCWTGFEPTTNVLTGAMLLPVFFGPHHPSCMGHFASSLSKT